MKNECLPDMIKALVKLCLLVILPIIYLLAASSYNPLQTYNDWLQEKIAEDRYKGVYQEIVNQLLAIDESQWENKINEIAENFQTEIQFKPIEQMVKKDNKQSRLIAGEYVSLNNDQGSVALRIADSGWAIAIANGTTFAQNTYIEASGPMYLFLNALDEIPSNQLKNNLTELESRFQVQIEILTDAKLNEIHNNRVIYQYENLTWIKDDNEDEVFLVKTESGLTLTLSLERNQFILNSAMFIPLILLVFCVCTGLLMWLWPLWKDHKSLTQTAKQFGAGHLDARAGVRKGSFTAELSTTFNRMAENIRNLIQSNQSLTNAVAHDLRTPMARLRFANDILKSGNCSTQEEARYRQTINASIEALDYLIAQTLQYSRYNRSTDINHFKNVCFATEVLQEVEQYQFDHEDILYETKIDSTLLETQQFVDQRALKRALVNLLNNATKHAKSHVLVSFTQQDDEFAIIVEDDGEGVAKKDYETIFQPYKQLSNQQRNMAEGVGLGLAIVKQIALWHNGEVHIKRSNLGGACFTLSWKTTKP
ncbi:MAG: ATP-binding protein [Marinicellaceae bacterium]